jgi:hypothetical protein
MFDLRSGGVSMTAKRPTIIVSGAVANKPFNGGNAWSRLSWISGFQRLGFDVYFVEQIDRSNCVDTSGGVTAFEQSVNLVYFRAVTRQFGLAERSSLIYDEGAEVYGVPLAKLADKAKRAVLFNISGHLTCADIKAAASCRIYYDDDPGFTQFWHAAGTPARGFGQHDVYFTIGENIGTAHSVIPTNGIQWNHTRPPVVLDDWPIATRAFDRFTTVASWRGAYGPVDYLGKTYGLKVHEFRKFFELPARVAKTFEIALEIQPADKKDLDRLMANGWQVVEPIRAAGLPGDFRRYIQNSGAEFSVAQNIYVDANSGWFSDRTVRYLASGKPVLVQDSGFSRHYPIGEGLHAFRTIDEAIDAAERIVRDYDRHCNAARRIAEEFFDSDRVIRRLASEAGLDIPT